MVVVREREGRSGWKKGFVVSWISFNLVSTGDAFSGHVVTEIPT